jgi:hypothetical protein
MEVKGHSFRLRLLHPQGVWAWSSTGLDVVTVGSALTLVQPIGNAVVDCSGLPGICETEVLSAIWRKTHVDIILGH